MKETDLTKLSRWIVPGWIAILSFLTFVGLDRVITGQSSKLIPDIFSFQGSTLFGQSLIVLIAAAAGVPLGFTIYQVYFYIRWNSPFAKNGFLPPIIGGRMNDIKQMKTGLKDSELTENIAWKKDWWSSHLTQNDHSRSWRFIENLFTEISQKLDQDQSNISLFLRQRYLHEVTHTLGASNMAIYFGYFTYLLIKFELENTTGVEIFLNLFLVIFFLYLVSYEEKREEDTKDLTQLEFPFRNLSSLAIFALFIFHALSNPVLVHKINFTDYSIYTNYLIRVVAIILLVIWWGYQGKENNKLKVSYRSYLILGTTIIFSLLFFFFWKTIPDFQYIKALISWSLFSSTSLFILSNLILVKNRQNAKEDELALINYTLKRGLIKDQANTGKINKDKNKTNRKV